VTGFIRVGSGPVDVTWDGRNLWVANAGSNTVSKINPVTNTVTATIGLGFSPSGVVSDGTNIWVTKVGSNTVSKIKP
jgi:YVTN family beta-propeller protein